MIKERRFMEDAHLSAAQNQASMPLIIDFHRVHSPPVSFLSTVSRDLFPRAPPLKSSTTESRDPRFVQEFPFLFFVKSFQFEGIHKGLEYFFYTKRCWSMIVKDCRNDVSLFSSEFDDPRYRGENGIFGWCINFSFFLFFFGCWLVSNRWRYELVRLQFLI